MATNAPTGDGHRQGAVRKRTQVKSPLTNTWTKRDRTTGEFIDQKEDAEPFKGVVKEPAKRDSKKRSSTRAPSRTAKRASGRTAKSAAGRAGGRGTKKKASRASSGGSRAKASTRKGR